jgi:hypothetical protein
MDDQNRHNAAAVLLGSAMVTAMAVTMAAAIVTGGIYPYIPGRMPAAADHRADARLREGWPFS